MVIHETGFLKLPELFVGKNDHLFHLKTVFPFRFRLQRIMPFEVVNLTGAVIEHSVFLIGFRLSQGDIFFRHTPQVDFAAVLSITKIQGISVLGNE